MNATAKPGLDRLTVKGMSPAYLMSVMVTERGTGDGWDAGQVGKLLGTPGAFGVVALERGQVVGHLLCTTRRTHLAVERVAVRPGVRRRGVASFLLAWAAGEAARMGLGKVKAWVPDDTADLGAHLLLKKAGFTGMMEDDYIKFVKRVTPA